MKRLLIMALLGMSYVSAQATVGAASEVKHCSSVAQEAPEGTICVTAESYQFKRYKDPAGHLGWEDIGIEGRGGNGGKFWADLKPDSSQLQNEAKKFCKDHGLTLPSGYSKDYNYFYGFPGRDSDFQTAERHGIREVLKDINNQLLWSASIYSLYGGYYAFVFTGTNGLLLSTGVGGRDSRSDGIATRCVGVSDVNR